MQNTYKLSLRTREINVSSFAIARSTPSFLLRGRAKMQNVAVPIKTGAKKNLKKNQFMRIAVKKSNGCRNYQ
jgi:hypothetical protein